MLATARPGSPGRCGARNHPPGVDALVKPDQSQAALANVRTWIETHEDQVIIAGCLIVGFWLIAHSIYLAVT